MMNAASKIFLVAMMGITLGGCSDKKDASADHKTEVVKTVPSIQVLNWGPKGTVAGKGFSVQKNGNSAIWFEQRGIGNSQMVEVWFGDRKLEGMAITPDQGGSAEVPAELIAKPGNYSIYLLIKPEGTRIEVGTFEVAPN